MIRSPDASERTPKAMPIRMRTLLVPLSGAALYYAVILLVTSMASLILGEDSVRYQNTVRAVTIILLLAAIFLWLRIYRIFEEATIMQEAVSVGKILSVGIIALGLLGLTMLYFYLVEKILSSIPAVRESVEEYKQWVEASPESLLEKIMYAVTPRFCPDRGGIDFSGYHPSGISIDNEAGYCRSFGERIFRTDPFTADTNNLCLFLRGSHLNGLRFVPQHLPFDHLTRDL